MNLEAHTTFELEEEQLEVVDLFLKKVDEYCENGDLVLRSERYQGEEEDV